MNRRYDEPLSNFAFNFNLRCYNEGCFPESERAESLKEGDETAA